MNKQELWATGREIVLGAPQHYIDIDVEADGVAGHGSVLSIGAQSPHGDAFYTEIKPYSQDFLPGHREFCDEHGLRHERLMDEAPELSVAMEGLMSWLANQRERTNKAPVFTAYNAAFDWAHVDLAFVKTGVEDNPFGIAPFDLKSLALPLTGDWDFVKTKKSKLPPEIIPEGDFTHHALEDAQYQQRLHFGMAALLGARRYGRIIRQ